MAPSGTAAAKRKEVEKRKKVINQHETDQSAPGVKEAAPTVSPTNQMGEQMSELQALQVRFREQERENQALRKSSQARTLKRNAPPSGQE